MNIIIMDFEVFKFDTLFGSIIIKEDGTETLFQTWDTDLIKQFYFDYKDDSIFVGWNSKFYDNLIFQQIVRDRDPYEMSKRIINGEQVWCNLKILSYDAMNTGLGKQVSLKLTELIAGDSIETTEVDFNLDRKLNEEEKILTEKYNQSDLRKTLDNFKRIFDRFELRLGIINTWNLDMYKCLDMTGAQIAAEVLQAQKDKSLAFKPVKPIIYDTLTLKNKQALDFYINEKFRIDDYFETIKIGNAELTLGGGGLHQALKKCYFDRLMYLDVSGYYNLVMINFNLLSRTIPEEGKKRYIMMYDQQIELKKIDPDSPKRRQFKETLLAVFGAQGHEGSALYDPQIGSLVPVVGEMYLMDFMEKIQDLCLFVNGNTDGIMLKPNSEEDEKEILRILDEWLKVTKFVIKPKYIYNMYQRDVNCYVYQDEKGKIVTKGEAVKNFDYSDEAYASGELFGAREASIIAKGIVNYLLFDKSPEETVEENKQDLRLFQYACKKGSRKYMTYDITYLPSNSSASYQIQSPSRVFASNSNTQVGKINLHGINKKSGLDSISKYPSLPDNIFVYNGRIIDKYEELKDKIDWQYYVNRIYEKAEKFIS